MRDGDLVVEVSTMPGDGIKVDPDRVKKMDEAKLDYTYDDTDEANASYIIESKPTKKIDDTENTMEEEDESFVSYDEIVPEKKNEFKPIDMPKIFKDKQSDPEQMKILEEQQREFENSLSDEVEEVRREIMAKNAAQQDKDSAVGGLAHSDGPVEEVSAISSKEPIVLPVITRAGKKDDVQEEEKSVAAEESAETADSGTDVLSDGLREAGADVVDVAVYRLREAGMGNGMLHMMISLKQGRIDVLAFSSPMSASSFISKLEDRYGKEKAAEYLHGTKIAAIGLPTSRKLEELGFKPDIVPEKTPFHDMLLAIREEFQQ